jgi:hypothetical protein
MSYKVGESKIKIRSFEHGLNNNDRPTDIGERYTARYPKYQCIDTINMILSNMTRKKGSEGLKYDISGTIEGMAFYPQESGDNTLLMVSGGKLYSVNTSTGALTELYNLTGSDEANFVTAYNKCFVCNGAEVVKVEGSNCYLLGIAPPSSGSTGAVSGGSLPDGTYKIIVGYARKVGGVNVLYSVGVAVSDVVIASPNSTAQILLANSSDPQVNNKIIWMTDAGSSSPYYFYHETDDNTTTVINVTSNSNKNSSLIYSSQAQNNLRPEAFEDITFLNNKIFGKIGKTIYYSKQAGTQYALECFPEANTFDLPHYIVSLFTYDDNLYANCINQIVKIPNGDPGQRRVEIYGKTFSGGRLYFKYPRTVINFSDYIIGLTQDGVRKFYNDKMISIDISKDVKPDITHAYNGSSSTVKPSALLLRQNDRTEYHLSYAKTSVGTDLNNMTLVLNLDTLSLDTDRNTAIVSAWEKYDTGFDFGAVAPDGSTVFFGQSKSGKSVIYEPKDTEVTDENIYVGDTFTESRDSESYVVSPYFVKDIRGLIRWIQIHASARQTADYVITVRTLREKTYSFDVTFQGSDGGFVLGVSMLGVDALSGLYPMFGRHGLPRVLNGKIVWVEIKQSEPDSEFQFIETVIEGKQIIGRGT